MKIIGISCGVFKKELEYLYNHNKIEINFEYISSMLHLKPTLLEKELNKSIRNISNKGYILVFGDCHSRMNEYGSLPNVQVVAGINCCEIFLGQSIYKKLRKKGAFILPPEWVPNFKNIFTHKLGFNSTNIKDFMADMHTEIVYLDTGVIDIPQKQLKDIADFTGLKLNVIKVNLNFLADAVNNAYIKLRKKLNE